MKPAQDRLAFELEQLAFTSQRHRSLQTLTLELLRAPVILRDALLRQVSAPVRWLESMELLIQHGVTDLCRGRPRKSFVRMMRQINRDATV